MTGEQLEGLPLSLQQHAAWTQGAGVVLASFRIEGAWDAGALSRALDQLTGRHEILRTAIRRAPGLQLPLQVIDPVIRPHLEAVGLITTDAFTDALHAEGAAIGDLATGPLVRVLFARTGETAHALGLAASSMILDGPSLVLLAGELAALMAAEPVNPEPLQYADVAGWQEDAIGSGAPTAVAARQRWGEAGAVAATLHPLQRASPAPDQDARPAAVELSDSVSEELVTIAGHHGVTEEIAALALWSSFLHRVSGLGVVAIGLESAGRPLPEMADALGPIARVVPFVLPFAVGDTLASVVRESARRHLEAEGTVEQCPVPVPGFSAGDPGSRFCWIRRGGTALASALVHLERIEEVPVSRALRLVGEEGWGPVRIRLDYDEATLTARAATSIAVSLGAFIRDAARTPDAPISRLALTTSAQREAILSLTIEAPAPPPLESVYAAVAARAAAAPEAMAVLAGKDVLAYRELMARAGGLAATLGERGIGPGDVVGLCMERSCDVPVAMLGILGAGATFLPMDPGYPPERLEFMLAETGARLVIVPGDGAATLPEGTPLLHLESPVTDGASHAPRASGTTAYIIYTSGTTGKPKGVAVSHSALCHYLPSIAGRLGVTPSDVYLHTASIAFSSSVRQLLMPLAVGATVVIAREEARRDPEALLTLIGSSGVTVIDLVPSMLRAVTDAVRRAAPARRTELLTHRLRLIASASEGLTPDLPRAWREEFAFSGRLVNMFGTTETTGIVTTLDCDASVLGAGLVPIGRPLPGVRVCVVDEAMALLPPGVAGELLLGGPTADNHFVADPGRTAERFIPDPVRPGAGMVFRTHDRVRLTLDGVLEFLGREDDMVKVRGVRIALGEIEAVLAGLSEVREVAVAVREDPRGDTQLVAYVVPTTAAGLDMARLRTLAAERLPTHMLPTALVLVGALPLTPNGKLDRSALPTPGRGGSGRDGRPARTALEDALCGVWSSVLAVPRVGVDDDFFDLGGHSLLATQLVSRVREMFRAELTLRTLFEAPTVSGMAEALRRVEAAPGLSERVAEVVVRTRTEGAPS